MRMAITWRNPRPVQTSHRCVKMTDIASGSVYVIQEMSGGAQEDQWADLSTLQVQDGGSVSGTGSQTRASCASPATAAKRNEQELRQPLVVSRICSLFGLRRGVSSVSKSGRVCNFKQPSRLFVFLSRIVTYTADSPWWAGMG